MLLVPVKPKRHKLCPCPFCKRGRKFYRIAQKLPEREREWMLGAYEYLLNMESELEMREAAGRN